MAGEPFLHEDLFNMIEYAKRKVGCVSVHTNATLLDKEMSLNILKSPLDLITFSFDGCTSEIYEKLRVGANFEKVKAQIEIFFELKKRIGNKKLLACVEIIKMKETEKYIPDFVQYWKNKGVDRVVVRPYITWLGLVDDHRVNISYNFGHKLCHNLFWNSTILYDGTVVPCCIDGEGRLPLGNVLKQPFNEIWNGNHYNRLRSYHLENAIPNNIICHGCTNTWIISRKEGRIKRAILRQLGVIKNSKA